METSLLGAKQASSNGAASDGSGSGQPQQAARVSIYDLDDEGIPPTEGIRSRKTAPASFSSTQDTASDGLSASDAEAARQRRLSSGSNGGVAAAETGEGFFPEVRKFTPTPGLAAVRWFLVFCTAAPPAVAGCVGLVATALGQPFSPEGMLVLVINFIPIILSSTVTQVFLNARPVRDAGSAQPRDGTVVLLPPPPLPT